MVSMSFIRENTRSKLEKASSPYLIHLPDFISPMVLTWGNLLFSICAGVAFAFQYFTLALILLVSAFLCDSLDGMVARVRNKSSVSGYYLDSGVDRLGEAVWLYGIFISGLFPQNAVFLLAVSAFLINYFRVQQARVFRVHDPGLMEKGERNIYFGFLTLGLSVNINIQALTLSLWFVCILSIATTLQLFRRGVVLTRGTNSSQIIDTQKLLEESPDRILGGT